MNENELIHYGVKGMKWGKRKARPEKYVTVRQANINARKAMRESMSNDRKKGGVTLRDASKNANQARKESIQKDLNKNREIRNETAKKKPVKKKAPEKKKSVDSVVASMGKMAVANVARYNQIQHTERTVSNMLSGDFGSASYNSIMARSYGNVNRWLYD